MPGLAGRVVHTNDAGGVAHTTFTGSCKPGSTACVRKGTVDPQGGWTRAMMDYYLGGLTDGFVSSLFSSDAFYGQNNKIRETLNNLILKSPQEWQTNVGLPFGALRCRRVFRPRRSASHASPSHWRAQSRLMARPSNGTNCTSTCGCCSVCR